MCKRPLRRHPLRASCLFRVRTRRDLAAVFGMTEPALQAIVRVERPYSKRTIDTGKNGKVKMRDVEEPRGALRPIHERVGALLSRIEPPDFLFCPVKGRSYVDNANVHAKSAHVRTLDVKSYFPSTPQRRVFWFFSTVMECSLDVSVILARLLTVDGHLATGSTVSPILSFYAFYDMWLAISEIAKAAECRISVYMDDLTVSGLAVPERIFWQIKKQIDSRGLEYHKERNFTRGTAEVTGVLLRDGKALVPNRQLRKAHLVRTEVQQTDDQDQIFALTSRLLGLISQRAQIELSKVGIR